MPGIQKQYIFIPLHLSSFNPQSLKFSFSIITAYECALEKTIRINWITERRVKKIYTKQNEVAYVKWCPQLILQSGPLTLLTTSGSPLIKTQKHHEQRCKHDSWRKPPLSLLNYPELSARWSERWTWAPFSIFVHLFSKYYQSVLT